MGSAVQAIPPHPVYERSEHDSCLIDTSSPTYTSCPRLPLHIRERKRDEVNQIMDEAKSCILGKKKALPEFYKRETKRSQAEITKEEKVVVKERVSNLIGIKWQSLSKAIEKDTFVAETAQLKKSMEKKTGLNEKSGASSRSAKCRSKFSGRHAQL
eukprot:GHVN01009208.1.p1 GENE.GHVN01009208.1~~GHVN01009208.1.p1  ORF type:complete len:156 (+),score=24.50 GHVN01009208.1:59-526(+)